MEKTFTIVGVSTQGKITKFRVANGDMAARSKVLERGGHTDIKLFELPTAMSKLEAIVAFKAQNTEYSELRMPNETEEKVKVAKVRTVQIKKGGTTGKKATVDAATALLNEIDLVDTEAQTETDTVTA